MIRGTPTPEELSTLEALRAHRRRHRAAYRRAEGGEHFNLSRPMTTGQRISDWVASTVGSWAFILLQTISISIWIAYNTITSQSWDPYPYILLNLLLSFQAAYTAPAIMMSQNRQAEIDRHNAQNDFEVNVKAELEIELLHEKIDLLKERELLELAQAIKELSRRLDVR